MRPLWALEDKNMQKENRNEEAVSPVIATILMVAITVVLAGVLYVWASQLAEGNTDGDFSMYDFAVTDASDAVGADSGEALVYVAMDTGDDLSGTACVVTDNGDGSWGFGEEVTVSEGSDDICAAACTVQVKILDAASNKLIYESSEINVA